jgi:DNA-binding beta-propeller fold protein YncE
MSRILVALLALYGISCGHAHHHHHDVPRDLVFVTNQGEASVTVIDPRTGTVQRTVDLTRFGFPANAQPHFVVADDDAWYVSLIGANRVAKFSHGDRLLGQVAVERAGMLALGADGLLYVSRSLTAVQPPASIVAIDRARMSIVREVALDAPHPHALATARHVYSASLSGNRVFRITPNGVDGITLPPPARGLSHAATSPDGRWLAVTADITHEVLLFQLDEAGSPTLSATWSVGQRPWHLHFAPDGASVFIPLFAEDRVVQVRVSDGAVLRSFTAPDLAEPYGTLVLDAGRTLVVASSGRQRVLVFDVPTGSVRHSVSVGTYPTNLGAYGAHH